MEKIKSKELTKGITKEEYDRRGGTDPYNDKDHRQAETTSKLAEEELELQAIRAGKAMFDSAEEDYDEHKSIENSKVASDRALKELPTIDTDNPSLLDESNQPNALTAPLYEGALEGWIEEKEAEKGKLFDDTKPIGDWLTQSDLPSLKETVISGEKAWRQALDEDSDQHNRVIKQRYNDKVNGFDVKDGFIEAAIEDAEKNHGVKFKTSK